MNKPDKKDALDQNKVFYNELYKARNIWLHLFFMMISFDQQSKAKLNRNLLKPFIREEQQSSEAKSLCLLDFGSGWGSFLKKMPRELKLYCHDLSLQAVHSVCRTLGKLGYDIQAADINGDTISKPRHLDFIVCSHVLEHVSDDRLLLNSFHQALAEQGKLLINVPINEVWDDPKHVREYTPDSMADLLRECGFHVLTMSEEDKWTGFLLDKEFGSGKSSLLRKLFLRLVRVALALTPTNVLKWSENCFFSDRANQQLLIVAAKSSPPQELAGRSSSLQAD